MSYSSSRSPRPHPATTLFFPLCALLIAAATLAAGEDPVEPPPKPPVAPTPAQPAELSPAAKAMIERIRQVRPNLSDEDGPTRDKALRELQTETAALVEALFRVPADEDSTDERRLLTLIANDLQAKVIYENNLMRIPAAQRAAVDTMLKKIPGIQSFFSADSNDRITLLDTLCAAKPDAATLAAFLATVMQEKDPRLVTAAFEHAAEAPSAAYLPIADDLLKKGFIELYLPKDATGDRMQMMMLARGANGAFASWHTALVKMITAIPGDGADRLVVDLFNSMTSQNQNQMIMLSGNRGGGNQMLFDIATAITKRGIQSAFPSLVKAAQGHSLMESGTSVNNSPVQYSSGADLMVYIAYKLIDPKIAERTPGQYGGLSWKNSDDRLKFYDDFLAAWQADIAAKKPNRDGIDEYKQWYENNHQQMLQIMELEKKQRAAQNQNTPDNGE